MAIEKKVLTAEDKQIIKEIYLYSHCPHMGYNSARGQANGFTMAMIPAIERIYGDDVEAKKEAYVRHNQYINTHTIPFALIASVCYVLEKEHKENGLDVETITNMKAALMGPTAGFFDSLFFNCLRVIASGVAIGYAAKGSLLAPFLFLIIYGLPHEPLRYLMAKVGYQYGFSFIDEMFESGLIKSLTKAASIIGMMMVGCMTATSINIPLALTITAGDGVVAVNDVLEAVMPGLLGVLTVFGFRALLKKGWTPSKLIILCLVIGLVGGLLKIF